MDVTPQSTQIGFDEFKHRYYAHLGNQASAALERKAKAGGWGGFAPTGYRNVAGGVELDPTLAPLVEEAFRLIARKRSSLRQVLAELAPRGLVSRTGKPLGVAALSMMIQNPFYAGMVRYKGHLYLGTHQPLVSPSLFDRAGRSLRRRRR